MIRIQGFDSGTVFVGTMCHRSSESGSCILAAQEALRSMDDAGFEAVLASLANIGLRAQ